MAIGSVAALAVGISVASARGSTKSAAPTVSDQRAGDFAAAAAEFKVPEPVLLAVSYALTGWSDGAGKADATGGFGPMHLTDGAGPLPDGRGSNRTPSAEAVAEDPALHTLSAAAELTKVPAETLKTNAKENIRGGAALLADYAAAAAKVTGGTAPTSVAGWYGAIARFGGGGDAMAGRSFADDVFGILRSGAASTVVDNERLALPKTAGAVTPTLAGAGRGFAGQDTTECPSGLTCRSVPAAYAAVDKGDPAAYGNFDPRPVDAPVKFIVLQAAAGTYDATIAAAQRPASYRSTHYVIRAADGQVTQQVATSDVAWHAGNWTLNSQSIGIAIEATKAGGKVTYSAAAVRSAAALVKYLGAQYDLTLDRDHVLAADEIAPGDAESVQAAGLPSFDWQRFGTLLGAPVTAKAWRADRVVTFNAPAGAAVALRTAPRADAPLLTSPTGAAARPTAGRTGESLAVAEQRPGWTAVWYGGTKAWFADPTGKVSVPGEGVLVTPAAGRSTIPVYRQAAPEPSELPSSAAEAGPLPLAESIAAGQSYVLLDSAVAQVSPATFLGPDRTGTDESVTGAMRYLMIRFDSRIAFVAADDVQITGLG